MNENKNMEWQQRTELLLGKEKWTACGTHMCWSLAWAV